MSSSDEYHKSRRNNSAVVHVDKAAADIGRQWNVSVCLHDFGVRIIC